MATVANPPAPLAGTSNGSALLANLPRALTILVTAAAVLAPLSLIFYQSFLSAPFFDARKTLGLDAYEFISRTRTSGKRY
jgi:iron(III) transport system permease protein